MKCEFAEIYSCIESIHILLEKLSDSRQKMNCASVKTVFFVALNVMLHFLKITKYSLEMKFFSVYVLLQTHHCGLEEDVQLLRNGIHSPQIL